MANLEAKILADCGLDNKNIWELEEIYNGAYKDNRRVEKSLDNMDPATDKEYIKGMYSQIDYNDALMRVTDQFISKILEKGEKTPQTMTTTQLVEREQILQANLPENSSEWVEIKKEIVRRKMKLQLKTDIQLFNLLSESKQSVASVNKDPVQYARDLETFGKELIDQYIEKEMFIQCAIQKELSMRGVTEEEY